MSARVPETATAQAVARLPFAVQAAAVLAAGTMYAALAHFGLALARVNAETSAVWPAAGLAVAAVLVLGTRSWPGLWAGAGAANFANLMASHVAAAPAALASFSIAAGNTFEAVAAAWIVRWMCMGPERSIPQLFAAPRTVAGFSTASFAAPVAAATVGVLTLAGVGQRVSPAVWTTWWLGDATGILIVAPVLLLWSSWRPSRWSRAASEEAGSLVVVAVCGAALYFVAGLEEQPLVFFAVPLLMTVAWRFGARAGASGTLLWTALGLAATLAGRGPFARPAGGSVNVALLAEQAFAGLVMVVVLTVAALGGQGRRLEESLRRARDTLEERVALRTRQLSEAQRTAHMGSWEWNLETGAILWSAEMFRLHGVGEGHEPTLENYLAFVHPDDAPIVRANLSHVLEGGPSRGAEYRIVRPDGTVRHVRAIGRVAKRVGERVVLMAGTVQDETDRRAHEEALAQSRERVQRLVEGTLDFAIVMLDPQGRVATWSAGATRIYGFTANDIVGKHFSHFYPADEVEAGKPGKELEIAQWAGRYEEEGVRLRRDGTRFWASVVTTSLQGEGFSQVTRDITERKATESHARDLERLSQAWAARQIVTTRVEPGQELQGQVARLAAAVERLNRRLPPGAPNLAEAIHEEVEERQERAIRGGIALDAILPAALAAPCDAEGVARAVGCLLDHAIEAGSSGRIRVEAPDAGVVALQVGLAAEGPKLEEARRIVEGLGGRVEVTDTPGLAAYLCILPGSSRLSPAQP
ncbi:MAG: MASE1 domain-containing protein [Thermoplasmatota archaeon]